MDGFKAYRYYLAIKLHFTTDKFNVFQNRGNVRGTREAFNARNDRYIFEKLAMKYQDDREIIQFFVSNFAYGNDTAIYAGQEAEDLYNEWQRRKQSLTKIFVDDLATMLTFLETNKLKSTALFQFTENEYPVCLKLFIGGKICIETLRIIDAPDDESSGEKSIYSELKSKKLMPVLPADDDSVPVPKAQGVQGSKMREFLNSMRKTPEQN